ncbi:uncharacterized protein LOC135089914 [Scylla paramamosain]|uniref:uncharacterized protein LOC135089914 n=1 Tax=Scylla paramamosain TaxID=85552 RepID=UPI0030836149
MLCGDFVTTQWANDQPACDPDIYCMTVHLFGGVWSPSFAGFALRQRRGILIMVSSIYDSLGLLAPVITHGKLIFQEECRRTIAWDEPLTGLNELACRRGKKGLQHLSRAYGSVSYLKTTRKDGSYYVTFVCGKAKLVPIKKLTIPCLELCSAVLASEADKQLRKDIKLPVSQSAFWTDSTAVIQYIRITKRRFLIFVANYMGMIHDMSKQWRYVSSESNPADDASRGVEGDRFTSENRWLRGPSFLGLDERD